MKSQNSIWSNSRAHLLAGAAIPTLALAAIASPAWAQDASPDDTAQATEETDGQGTTATPRGEAIVVTGSRIRRDEFSSPSPITVIDPRESAKQGLIDTADMIQGSPVAAGSNQITSAISSNFVTNGGSGAQTISLRGLGAERTLVLLNGRRAGPAGTRGAVSAFDLNVLPQQMMERVDILKDGASSIYGSDAVAGVVNLITKTHTDGLEVDLFASVPFDTGGEQLSASATWGKEFDRGHFIVSGNYYKQKELARKDRKYLGCPEAYVFTDETYKTRADLIDPRTGDYHCAGDSTNTWGHVWTYDYSYFYTYSPSNLPGSAGQGDVFLVQYDYPGHNLGQYIPGVAPTGGDPALFTAPAGWYVVGYDPASQSVLNSYHPLMGNDSVIPETTRYTIYADASYELSDSIEAYGEFLYNHRKNYLNGSRQVWQFGFPGDFAGFGFGDPFASGWGGAVITSPTGFTDHFDSSVKVDYYRGVFGFKGDFSPVWSWDVYGQYSRSDGAYSRDQTLNDSIRSQNFRTESCVGTTTPYGNRPCVDVDWYSGRVMYGDYTPEEEAFLFGWETGHTRYTQKYVEGSLAGDTSGFLELPGGPIGIALGATYREDSINDTPGAISYIPDDTAPNGFINNAWGVTASGITAGKSQTKEMFGEIKVPLLADVPFFQSLEFTAAARVTNVKAVRASDGFSDSDNGNWTYKLGADWEINDWVRLRGTYGTSFRAPALFEQFLSDQTSFLGQRDIDPCINWGTNLANGAITQQFADNCVADGVIDPNHTGAGIEATITTGGGIGVLEPETSRAWTASVIFTPHLSFLPDTDISLAIDYFNIEVNGEIAQLGPANILTTCYASDFFPNDPVCDLFARNDDVGSPPDAGDPSNVSFVEDSYINVNSQKNEGLDVTARLVHDFGNDTRLSIQAIMTWQFTDTTALFSGNFESDNGESGEPKWVGDFRVNFDKGPWNFFYGLDVVGGTDDRQDYLDNNGTLCPTFTVYPGPICLKLTLPATFYHSASITREINDRFRITVGMTNITNEAPPRASQVGGDGITQFGTGVLTSQYDLLGRRAFINVGFKY